MMTSTGMLGEGILAAAAPKLEAYLNRWHPCRYEPPQEGRSQVRCLDGASLCLGC